MKISVYGLGYVGLTTAACALKSGHTVHGVDANSEKVKTLSEGHSPIYEPGLEELLSAGINSGDFTIASTIGGELADADIAMVCVGTPSQVDGSHNMNYVIEVTRQIASSLADLERKGKAVTLVYRSTMTPGTMTTLVQPILDKYLGENSGIVELVYHPEFLRESSAIADYFSPPKIVYGTVDSEQCSTLEELYADIEAPRFATHYPEAEMTKFVDNSFHALKVAFANEIGRVAYENGISAAKIMEIFVADTKLNISPYYLRPGGAFGGSCLPKDIRALSSLSQATGITTQIIDSLILSNEEHKQFLFRSALKEVPAKAKVLLIGLAFKAESDDLRESPFLDMAVSLLEEGYDLTIFEPHFNATALHGANLSFGMTHLPDLLNTILNDTSSFKNTHYDLILDGRGTAGDLPVTADKIFNLTRLP